ncbi:hypothetical protein [Leptolyngbya ohadii]|uniref:hypothetical protein n=1 Tax=Leptolyngbya ohadii TaxID=1962290 RepID=UPI0015C66CCC|nr:hypothetical protein [Leptolyngbya ohadii]
MERQAPQQRNFVIPGCATTICCTEDEGLSVDQLLSIVFSLAHSNPDAKVDFWIKVMPE